MKQIETNGHLLVDVPEGAYNITIDGNKLVYNLEGKSLLEPNYKLEILPPGQYTIIGRQKEVGEDVAGEIVSCKMITLNRYHFVHEVPRFYDYRNEYHHFQSAKLSLASFCRANGMDNPLIIKID